ncbi:MAG: metallophosphoesterase family protein [Cocleimonas sp.]
MLDSIASEIEQQMQHSKSTLTVAVVSDTHSYIDPQIVDLVKECDVAVHAGDICGADIIKSLEPKSGKVYVVTGNNDPYCHLTGVQLPEILSFEAPGGIITIEHGHEHGAHQPDHSSLRATHPDAKVIIYGHTHKQVIDNTATPWVVNPGAAGKTRNHGGPSCLIIECSNAKEWKVKKFRF